MKCATVSLLYQQQPSMVLTYISGVPARDVRLAPSICMFWVKWPSLLTLYLLIHRFLQLGRVIAKEFLSLLDLSVALQMSLMIEISLLGFKRC